MNPENHQRLLHHSPPAGEPFTAEPKMTPPLGDVATSPFEEVRHYLHKTGFPDLTLVSSRILEHGRQAVLDAAHELKMEVRFLAYDSTCSVAKGKALPGSDLDDLTAVVELTGMKRQSNFWDRLWLHDAHSAYADAERSAAQKLEAAFKARLDYDLIGRDQTLKVISLCELEQLFSTYSQDDDSIPFVISEAEDLAVLQKGGSILIDKLYRLNEKWGQTDAFQRYLAAAQELDPFPLPNKFKVQSRTELITQFNSLPQDEQLLIIEIMRSDVSDAKRPAVLQFDSENPFLDIARKLEKRGLLLLFNPQDEKMMAAIQATNNRVGWMERTYLRTLELQRYVAPWKLYHADEMILSELFDPSKMRLLHQRLEALSISDGLPRPLRAWWSGIHIPGYNKKTDNAAANLATNAIRKS